MAKQSNVLQSEKFIGAPIERAHLHRGFKAKKTPLKWIKFFRSCVLQREVASKKKSKKLKNIWLSFFAYFVLCIVLICYLKFSLFLVVIGLTVAIILNYRTNKQFKKNYTNGFDFFADYFSAFFTLIEEDLMPQSKIFLDANLKETISKDFLSNTEQFSGENGFMSSRKQNYYEREISTGMFTFSDESMISFQFIEKIRQRIVRKKGSSGKMKTKGKYKAVYPFTLKMKISKGKYNLNSSVNTEDINVTESDDFFTFKVRRRFDPKTENPNDYNPYESEGITTFAVDYFSLELINLINACYSCVTPKG